jgi:RPA family protein
VFLRGGEGVFVGVAANSPRLDATNVISTMSATNSGREVAQRAFATEFADATHQFQESDEERAPKYALLPTGKRANRVFAVGTLTETEDIGSESEYWQARVVDPTGKFFVYAGQYQPEAMAFLRDADAPEYAAVVGKPNTYETENENGETETYVSIRPEEIRTVEESTRDRWVAETAEQTLERVEAFLAQRRELDDIDVDPEATAPAFERALSEYGLDVSAYHEAATDALSGLLSDDDAAD